MARPMTAEQIAMLSLVEGLDQVAAHLLSEGTQRFNKGSFGYVGLAQRSFAEMMNQLVALHAELHGSGQPMRFLDVGCGIGTNVMVAAHIFDQADGIDVHANYVEHAENLLGGCGLENSAVSVDDALTFERYDQYDVVYLYRPFGSLHRQAELETIIASRVRPGTFIAGPLCDFDNLPQHRPALLAPNLHLSLGEDADGRLAAFAQGALERWQAANGGAHTPIYIP